MIERYGKLLGGVLLVAGTTIGAGMLALPIETGMAGFFPSLSLLVVYWAYMTFTALLMLEVALWMEGDTNLITMAHNTLGKWAEILAWGAYLFLLYALSTAYIVGSGTIITNLFSAATGYNLPLWSGALPLLALFSYLVYQGVRSVDYVNRAFMVGLAIAYVLIVFFVSPHVEKELIDHTDWKFLFFGISLVAVSFGYHIIIPTLKRYLDGDVALLRRAILIGSAIPLLIYIVWNFVSLGVIPVTGEHGLTEAYAQGEHATTLIAQILGDGHENIALVAHMLAFCAIITSFLGVTLSLRDFLADGLHIKKTAKGKLILDALTFIPPLLITIIGPRAFFTALEFAGGFGVTILLGLLPALMVWSGRYHKGYSSERFKTPGGKPALIVVIAFSVLVVGIELCNQMGWTENLLIGK